MDVSGAVGEATKRAVERAGEGLVVVVIGVGFGSGVGLGAGVGAFASRHCVDVGFKSLKSGCGFVIG